MFKTAVNKLAKADPVLAKIIRGVGPCRLRQAQGTGSYFEALVEAIVYQQLNAKAAATIFGRFRKLYGTRRFPMPDEILRTPDIKLRGVGLSRQKVSCLKDLAHKVGTGSLALDSLHMMSDESVVESLTQVKGIGRWTSEMFLMFRLGRVDVLPTGDYGFRTAMKKAYRLRKLPEAGVLKTLTESWRPYRSVATWYLWQSLDGKS